EVVPPTEPPAAVDAPPAENATEEPTVAPTEPPDTRRHVSAVVSILDEAGNDNPGSRSAYKLLEQYLIEARDTGATDGCRNPNISVPADYNLRASAPEQYDEIIALAPELEPAIDQTNAGLALLRTEIENFQVACRAGDTGVASYSGSGLAALQQIRIIFDNANEQINLLLAN
ncbi:MAG: hypothetical protein AAFV33_15410, partial [Chloroflexota bacterium]